MAKRTIEEVTPSFFTEQVNNENDKNNKAGKIICAACQKKTVPPN